jgi:MFS family permease
MASTLLPVAALLFSSAFLLIAGGLHGLLLPIQGAHHGFSTFELGLIGTGWSIGFVCGCLTIPPIVRRVGHVRVFAAVASVAAVVILLNLLILTPIAWILMRALSGFCFAGAAMVVESWLNERASKENRGTIFSIYQMVNFGASTAGQLLMVITPPSEFFFFVVGAIFYCLAILPTTLSTAQHPRPLKTNRLDLRRLYANSPVAAVGCVLIGLVNGAFGTLGAVYGHQIGLPDADVALLMAAAVLGGSLIQFPLGRISDRMDRRKVMIGAAVCAIVAATAIVLLQPRDPSLVIGLVVLFGASIYPMYALAVAHANDFAGSEDFVKIAGGLLLLVGFGTMLGPILAAQAMSHWMPEGLFAFAAAVHLLLALYALYRMSRRAVPVRLAREAFQGLPVPKTATPESAVLDPRAPAGRNGDGGRNLREPPSRPADAESLPAQAVAEQPRTAPATPLQPAAETPSETRVAPPSENPGEGPEPAPETPGKSGVLDAGAAPDK